MESNEWNDSQRSSRRNIADGQLFRPFEQNGLSGCRRASGRSSKSSSSGSRSSSPTKNADANQQKETHPERRVRLWTCKNLVACLGCNKCSGQETAAPATARQSILVGSDTESGSALESIASARDPVKRLHTTVATGRPSDDGVDRPVHRSRR